MRIIKIFLLFFLLSILTLAPKNLAYAQSDATCSDVKVTSGDSSTQFRLTAFCSEIGAYFVVIRAPGNSSNYELGINYDTPDGNINYVFALGEDYPVGEYTVTIYFTEEVGFTTFTYTGSGGETPTYKECCTYTTNEPDNFCAEVNKLISGESGKNCMTARIAEDCPPGCGRVPAIDCGYPDTWFCAAPTGNHPALCKQAGKVGIDSAIGCIPIEDINLTTEFLLRWSLGIGGGIALFLVALSGIKIMTTQGDPKRLQDARDTLSAAIAGLILILLSIFIIRFISEELINLF